jgi:ubiquinone/menaquinone biosynthesis C-methylase UbiE
MVGEKIVDQYRDYYGNSQLSEWRRLGAIDKVENIRELVGSVPLGAVVDIGCGDGAVITEMARMGVAGRYVGVDISESAIQMAAGRSVAGAAFRVFDGDCVPFADKEFDIAILSHVVEHLENPRRLLQEARRVGKKVLVEVPCEHTIRLSRDYLPTPVGHINFYTPITIRRLLQTCGLEVERQITKGCSLPVMKFESPRGGLAKYLLREAALKVSPRWAPGLFVYHTALLCR